MVHFNSRVTRTGKQLAPHLDVDAASSPLHSPPVQNAAQEIRILGGGSPILLLSSSTFPSHSTNPAYSNCLPTQLTKLNRCQPRSSLILPQTSFLHMLAPRSRFCFRLRLDITFSSSLQRLLHKLREMAQASHPVFCYSQKQGLHEGNLSQASNLLLIKSSLSCSTEMLFTDCDHGKSIIQVYLATSFRSPWRANKHPTATGSSRIQAF